MWTETAHITRQDQMRRTVRSIDALKVCVETDEITDESTDHVFDVLRYHGVVGSVVEQAVGGGPEDRVPERIEGEVSADVMGGRVDPNLVFEPSGGDLEVVIGITPATEPRLVVVVPDAGVVDVMSVYGPVPVRLGAVETALVDEGVLEIFHVGPVPWEEESGVMDDFVQVHMRVYDIIVEGTLIGDGWDEGDVRGDGGVETCVMWKSGKAIDGIDPGLPLAYRELSPFFANLGILTRGF